MGRQHGVHVNLCLHRIPGYCVNGRELEPFQLFDSPRDSMQRALDAASHHWRFFAERYRDVPSSRLSFDLFNEPPFMADQSRYVEIAKALIAAIRARAPTGSSSPMERTSARRRSRASSTSGIVQSSHDYQPKMISHYKANWVPPGEFESLEKPTWPMVDKHGVLWNREKLQG
jgi:endoglucanase